MSMTVPAYVPHWAVAGGVAAYNHRRLIKKGWGYAKRGYKAYGSRSKGARKSAARGVRKYGGRRRKSPYKGGMLTTKGNSPKRLLPNKIWTKVFCYDTILIDLKDADAKNDRGHVQYIANNSDAPMRANNTDRAEITGSSAEPVGWDTYQALYNKYYCYAVKYELWFTPITASPDQDINVTCWFDDDTGADTDVVANMPAQLNGKTKVMRKYLATNDHQSRIYKMTLYKRFKRLLDLKAYGDDLSAAMSASPTKEIYFHVQAMPLDGVGSNAVVYAQMRVKCTQWVMLSEPIELNLGS